MTTLKELRDKARAAGIKGFSKMRGEELEQRLRARESQQEATTTEPITVTNAAGGTVTVSRVGDTVTVRWLCGATRDFATEDLATALERFEVISARGLWYEDTDSHHRVYAACVADGEFHGDEVVDGRTGTVPWPEFKAALEASLT